MKLPKANEVFPAETLKFGEAKMKLPAANEVSLRDNEVARRACKC